MKAANGSRAECLFIGGPWDGRRAHVESECKIFHVTREEDSSDIGVTDDASTSAPSKTAMYRRGVLRAPGREWSVFFAPDVDEGDVIGRLIAGYSPASVRGKARG